MLLKCVAQLMRLNICTIVHVAMLYVYVCLCMSKCKLSGIAIAKSFVSIVCTLLFMLLYAKGEEICRRI